MGKRLLLFLLLAICLWAAGCSSDGVIEQQSQRPQLVGEITLTPADPLPTRALSPTPIALSIATAVPESALQVATVSADFQLVTPTLPPSKTPTTTPTVTPTTTETPPPSQTAAATATTLLVPTSIVAQVTLPVPAPLPAVCESTWFFINPRPPNCPLNVALASQAVYQQFEQGLMIWVREQNAIYVMYDSAESPRWQVFPDRFQEGMPEYDPAYNDLAPSFTWQPRRGFGMIWRDEPGLRLRIGWAVREREEPYSTQVQVGPDGVIYLQEPRGSIVALQPNGTNWDRYRR